MTLSNNRVNKLEFLNHSCLIVESGKTKILCDPWFTGAAFNNGWRLLYEDSHNINQIECDYVWISHEHPDHFSIPTLSQISKSKHFLYQQTSDKKVKDWLEKKQHSVTELEDGTEYDLGDIKLTSFISDGYDSAALFKFPNGDKFLNLNDARVELGDTIQKIKKHDLSHLKIISIQFSYANWAGNENDNEIPFHQQDLVIERIIKIYEAFKPEKIFLFASYVYYSHEENFFWNKKFWLTYVVEKLAEKGINLIIPKPNQVIGIDEVANKNFIEENKADICASIQYTIVEILMEKLKMAVTATGIKQIAIGGGVSANSGIRNTLKEAEGKYGWKTFIPKFEYTTDNAAMIGIVGYQKYLEHKFNDAAVVSKARIKF